VRDNARKTLTKFGEFDSLAGERDFPLCLSRHIAKHFAGGKPIESNFECVCERINVIYRKRIILHNLAVPSALMARGLTPPDVAVHREQTRKPRLFLVYKYCTIN
jgi:hypothetical protein